jgi:hypothetical protein
LETEILQLRHLEQKVYELKDLKSFSNLKMQKILEICRLKSFGGKISKSFQKKFFEKFSKSFQKKTEKNFKIKKKN